MASAEAFSPMSHLPPGLVPVCQMSSPQDSGVELATEGGARGGERYKGPGMGCLRWDLREPELSCFPFAISSQVSP